MGKANEETVRSDFNNHEFKISTLDRNLIRMAQDFETFQKAINKIHFAILELQEVNRDVLLGKKSLNCLSCGRGDPVTHVQGKDGKLYRALDKVAGGDRARPNQYYSHNLNNSLDSGPQFDSQGFASRKNLQSQIGELMKNHTAQDSY